MHSTAMAIYHLLHHDQRLMADTQCAALVLVNRSRGLPLFTFVILVAEIYLTKAQSQ